ncbi:MAG: cardiolipin synthase [Paracoccaceae bacterium]
MMAALGAAFLVSLWSLAAWFAVKAMRTARTPQGSVGWVVFLLSAPIIAVPAYLFLGHSRYPGFISMRRASERVIAGLDAQRSAHGGAVRAEAHRSAPRALAYERLANMPITAGNEYRLLIDGEATFGAIFAAIEAAERYVLVCFYILRDDMIGRELADLLVRRAGEGVKVRVLYDAIGSNGLPKSYLARLREAGVDIRDFHAIRRRRNPFQLNFRNHRKIVVVDGRIGFVGGLNVGDEYMGRDQRFGRWRDTHLQLRGPSVTQLQLVFAEDWHWSSNETPDFDWSAAPVAGGVDALILAPGPADPMETGSLYFLNAIGGARQRIWIASPYFVPDSDALSALKLAALRGVDVRILMPAMKDHLTVWLAAYAYFDEMREAGVRIWRQREGFMHQKALVVDGELASIGTVNLDIRSCRLNFEVTAILFGEAAAAEVASMLETDIEGADLHLTRLADETPLKRYGAPIARLFAPLL